MVATVVTCGGLCPGLNAVWGPGMVRGMSAGPIERYPNPLILERRTNYSKYIYIIFNFTYYIYIYAVTHTLTHTHIIYIYIHVMYMCMQRERSRKRLVCVSQAKDQCNGNSSAIFLVFKAENFSGPRWFASWWWCWHSMVRRPQRGQAPVDWYSCHPSRVAPRLTDIWGPEDLWNPRGLQRSRLAANQR